MVSEEMEMPYEIPAQYPRGRYLLLFDPLDGSSNVDVDVTVGTIFSVLLAPDGVTNPVLDDFLQPGTRQVAAGYALYGPSVMLVVDPIATAPKVDERRPGDGRCCSGQV